MKNSINIISLWTIAIILALINYSDFKYKTLAPALALIIGIILTQIHRDSIISLHTKKYSTKILNYAVILFGFGFNLNVILQVGISSLLYTAISISCTLIIGLLLGKLFKSPDKVSTLISAATAICGGSAIAAIAPLINSSAEENASAMGIVFLLNAIALITFPFIGHQLHLSQHQFGLFSALAIHDTSSVVGSCMSYGATSLIVGTTVKLVRALWILPLSIVIAVIYHRNNNTFQRAKKPWFILWFILASMLVTIFPQLTHIGVMLKHSGESLFIIALFLIGYNVSLKNLQQNGLAPLLQAVILWLIVLSAVIAILKFNIFLINFVTALSGKNGIA